MSKIEVIGGLAQKGKLPISLIKGQIWDLSPRRASLDFKSDLLLALQTNSNPLFTIRFSMVFKFRSEAQIKEPFNLSPRIFESKKISKILYKEIQKDLFIGPAIHRILDWPNRSTLLASRTFGPESSKLIFIGHLRFHDPSNPNKPNGLIRSLNLWSPIDPNFGSIASKDTIQRIVLDH